MESSPDCCSLMIGASTCKDGCKYLRGRLQVLASEMGKTGTEIVSPILDKRKGRRDTPHTGHCLPSMINLVNRYLPARFGCFSRESQILCGSVLFGVFQPQVHSLDVLHHTVQRP